MNRTTTITIIAPYERIFPLAAKVEEWGHILPHYRYVRVLKAGKRRKLLRMSAWRNFIPVTWTAVQTVIEGSERIPGTIVFHHTRGVMRGMDVAWTFEPRPDHGDVVVRITHHLHKPPFPIKMLGKKGIDLIVGKLFIEYIARKTLKRIKMLAERESC
jgi:ribosome-associated toxin RatA of RatAB toxin-antitoxin module